VVKWLHEHRDEGCTTYAMVKAAESGHLNVVKWLHLHRRNENSDQAMTKAIYFGHFDIVMFLHKPGKDFVLADYGSPILPELQTWLFTTYSIPRVHQYWQVLAHRLNLNALRQVNQNSNYSWW
ncbi:hypothetical protein PHMEG_00028265, partial [Phytophthora megakarya]